jgi:hypothetical protein
MFVTLKNSCHVPPKTSSQKAAENERDAKKEDAATAVRLLIEQIQLVDF